MKPTRYRYRSAMASEAMRLRSSWFSGLPKPNVSYVPPSPFAHRLEEMSDNPTPLVHGEFVWKECYHNRSLIEGVGGHVYREHRTPGPSYGRIDQEFSGGFPGYYTPGFSSADIALFQSLSSLPPDYKHLYNAVSRELRNFSVVDGGLLTNLLEFVAGGGIIKVGGGMLKTFLKALRQARLPWKTLTWHEVLTTPIAATLAYKFGIKPLFDSLRDPLAAGQKARRALEASAFRDQSWSTIKQTQRTVTNIRTVMSDPWPGTSLPSTWFPRVPVDVAVSSTHSIFVPVVAAYQQDAISDLKYWLDAYGFSSPVSNFWELVPLSFVVDWFFDVQSYANHIDTKFFRHSALQSVRRVGESWVCQTTTLSAKGPASKGEVQEYDSGRWWVYDLPAFSRSEERFSRYPALVQPSLSLFDGFGMVATPSFRFSLNTSQSLTLVELIAQRVIRR